VVAAAYNSLQPVIAVLVLGALGEAPGARNLTGSFLIVAGGFAAVALSTNDLPALEEALRRRGERGGGAGGREARADRAREASARRAAKIGPHVGTAIRREVRRALEDAEKARTLERGGTVRIARPRADEKRERRKLAPMIWTAAWALTMSLCALAGGGLITWSLVWVYWKLLL
jgi:hypothetical protein